MRRLTLGGLLLLAAAAAAAVLWPDGGAAEAARGGTGAGAVRGAEATVPPPWDPDRVRPAHQGGLVFHGRCVDDRGYPLEGATVTLRSRPFRDEMVMSGLADPEVEPREFVTAADGVFTLRLPARANHRVTLDFTRPGHVMRASQGSWRSDEPRVLDYGDVVLPRGVPVRGSVRTPEGAAVAGARVAVGRFLVTLDYTTSGTGVGARSDADGRLEFRSALPPGEHEVRCTLRGYARVGGPRTLTVRGDEPEVTLDLVLEPGRSISGAVFGADGTPAAGAWVRAVGEETRSRPGTVGEDGSFTVFDDGAVEAPFLLEVGSRDDWETTLSDRAHRWGERDVRLTAERTPTLDLLVVEAASGAPVEDYAVRRMQPGGGSDPVHAGAHPGGRARVGGFRPGLNILQIVPRDPALRPSPRILFEWDDADVSRRVELERMRPVRLRVVDGAGMPVRGSHVALLDRETEDMYLDARDTTRVHSLSLEAERQDLFAHAYSSGMTDPTGALTLYLPDGAARGYASVEGEHPPTRAAFDVPAAEAEVVELVVASGGSVRGVLLHPGVADGSVGLVLRGGSSGTVAASQVLRTESDGSFLASSLAPGRYRPQLVFGLTPRGRGPSVGVTWYPECMLEEFDVVEGAETEVTLDGRGIAVASLRGTVELGGRRAAGQRLALVQDWGVEGRVPAAVQQLRTDGAGRFTVPALRPGAYRVSLDTELGTVLSDTLVEVAAGGVTEAAFACRVRTLDLVVLAPDGRPLAAGTDLHVTPHLEHLQDPQRTQVGRGGRLTLHPAPAGTFWVTAFPGGGVFWDSERILLEWTSDHMELELPLKVRPPYEEQR